MIELSTFLKEDRVAIVDILNGRARNERELRVDAGSSQSRQSRIPQRCCHSAWLGAGVLASLPGFRRSPIANRSDTQRRSEATYFMPFMSGV